MLQELADTFSLYNLMINYLIVLSIIFIYAYFTKKHKEAKKVVRITTLVSIAFLAVSLVTNHFNDKALEDAAELEAQKIEAKEYFDSRMQELSPYAIKKVDKKQEHSTHIKKVVQIVKFPNFPDLNFRNFRKDACVGWYEMHISSKGLFGFETEYTKGDYTVNTNEEIDSCIIEEISKGYDYGVHPFIVMFGKEPQEVLNECSISKDCPEMLEIIAVKSAENIEQISERNRLRLKEEAKEEAELRAYNEEQRIKAEQAKWEAERPQRMEAKIDAMIKRDAEKQAENDELKAKIEKLEALLETKEG